MDHPATGQSTMDQSAMDHSAMDQLAMDQSTMDQSAMDQPAIDQSHYSPEDPLGNLGLANISSLDPKNDLMSLIHQINLNNSGNINVNFQLR